MTDDPVLTAVQRFMDAVELRLARQAEDTRAALAEIRSASAEMQTRAAQHGPAGTDGAPGRDGVDGKDGRDGKDGERGPAGEKGERGADGLAGRDGAPGAQGERGADGLIGPAGERGERGADGLAGRDGAPSTVPGPQGERGERGADGIATREELHALIEARYAELHVRTLADYHQRTFERGTQYKRGAIVAWGGATHLAMSDTDVVPGTSPDWQMLAKPGRDGRDRK